MIDEKKLIEGYLEETDWRVRENANRGYSVQGLNNLVVEEAVKNYWLDEIYGKVDGRIRDYHERGFIHIHDLGFLGPYCVGWDVEDLLRVGFRGAEGKTESRPAKHFRTALLHVVNFLYTMQGEAAGAVALANFDTYLAPFIRADRLSYREVKQALQEFVYNMNIPTRVGFQVPFSNITMDVMVPESLKSRKAIVGGVEQDFTYGDCQREMGMLNEAFCEVMLEGDAKGRPFTFPIPTYNITREFPWRSRVGDLIAEMTAKYGTPYFANCISSGLSPDDVRSMCCRLRLDNREVISHFSLKANKAGRKGGLFASNPLTGSIGVVTVNLPRLGYLAKGSWEKFYRLLSDVMDVAKLSLEVKRKTIEELTEKGLYPYSRFYLRKIKEETGHYWTNHFSTVGLVGMHECLVNMGIKGGIVSEEGAEKAKEIMEFMLEKVRQYQAETGNLYNLEATPAEGASYRLARIDREEFGSRIYTSGEREPYYTNSVHPPVDAFRDPFDLLEHQEELQVKFTGGTVVHIWLGHRVQDIDALKWFVMRVFERFKVPYITLTPTFSICPEHGYIEGEVWNCPICGRECEVFSRVVGYYRPVQAWNRGKQEEFRQRNYYDFDDRRGEVAEAV